MSSVLLPPHHCVSTSHLHLPSVQLARWSSRALGSTWPGCTTSTCSTPASTCWSPGKSPSSAPSSSPPSPWRSTPRMSLCPFTCDSHWSFSLGSPVSSLRAPWHEWPKRWREFGGKRSSDRLDDLETLFTPRSITAAHQDWKHAYLKEMIWKSEPLHLIYIPTPVGLPPALDTPLYITFTPSRWHVVVLLFLPTCPAYHLWFFAWWGHTWVAHLHARLNRTSELKQQTIKP